MSDHVRIQLAVTAGVANAALVGVISMALGLNVIWPGMVFSFIFATVFTLPWRRWSR